ncbi:MAG: S8 family serine peptidase [Gemmatales bacterium]
MTQPRPASIVRTVRLACESLEDRLQPATGLTGSLQAGSYLPDHLLVQFKPEATPVALAGTTLTSELSLVPGLFEVQVPGNISLSDAIAAYSADPRVLSAQPDYIIEAEALPNDPQLNQQWAITNPSAPNSTINAPRAWDSTTGSGRTIVAVIDTGVDYTHPDLAANMWRNTNEIAGNGIDDDGNGYTDDYYGYNFVNNNGNPMDQNGHGTHVAGILGAVGNNGIGVTGVNWNVKIMALRFLDANGKGSTSAALKALNYAVQMGATISNNSWTSPAYDSALEAGIRNAGLAGHIYVAAAGNLGQNADTYKLYPGSYALDNVVTVAALESTNRLATWSNYGQSVEIAAPGSGIYSTLPGGRYGYMSGTSMATPFVTGAIALVRDQNPSWSAQQVIQRVLSTADNLTTLNGKIKGGRLNVGAAVTSVPVVPPPPTPDLTGARVIGLTNLISNSKLIGMRVTFNEAIQAGSFGINDVLNLTGPLGSLTINSVQAVSGSNTQFDILFAGQTRTGNYSLTLDTGILDLAGNALNQNNNATNGEQPADRYTGTVTYTATNTYAATNVPLALNDYSTTLAPITVTDSMLIGAVRVQINVSHGWMSDLVIKLRSPSGVEIILASRRGGGGKGYSNTIFDDTAAKSILQGTGLFTGSFRPEQALALFKNQSTAGTWNLVVEDKAKGDRGTLLSWSLTFDASAGSSGISSVKPKTTITAPAILQALASTNSRATTSAVPDVKPLSVSATVNIAVNSAPQVMSGQPLAYKPAIQQQKQQLLKAWQEQLRLPPARLR